MIKFALFGIVVVWIGSEAWLSLARRTRRGAAASDRYSLLLIWIVNTSAIVLGVAAAYQFPSWDLPHSSQWFVPGMCVLAAGSALRWYAIRYLGSSFTTKVVISADQRLIESGPYRCVRHPSYTGALLAVLGFALSTGNLASVLIMVVPGVGVQLWRMHVEEQALLDAFGDQYRRYMHRTRRLIPWVY